MNRVRKPLIYPETRGDQTAAQWGEHEFHGITEYTVRLHIHEVLRKTGLSNRKFLVLLVSGNRKSKNFLVSGRGFFHSLNSAKIFNFMHDTQQKSHNIHNTSYKTYTTLLRIVFSFPL